VRADKRAILRLLIELREQGLTIAGYGAPAKGNTLLNYCGIGSDFIDYTCDLSPHKQVTCCRAATSRSAPPSTSR